MNATKEIIDRALEFIKDKIKPDKIYLFGSYAKGNFTKDSDLDFFIIKDSILPKYQRALPLYTLDKSRRIGASIGIDFVVYTPKEFEESKNENNSLAGEVFRTGKLIYAK